MTIFTPLELVGDLTPLEAALEILGELGNAKPAPQVVAGLLTWFEAEGGAGPQWGHADNVADFNPLNTTRVWRGSRPTPGNDPPVQAYASWTDGIAATVATLEQANMAPIAHVLRADGTCAELATAVGESAWGTGDFAHDCAPVPDVAPISVPTDTPPPPPPETPAPVAPASTAGPVAPVPTPPATPAPPEGFDMATLATIAAGSLAGGTVRTAQAVRNAKSAGAGIDVDGDFGPITEGAVRSWQAAHGLVVDGIVGPLTWASLLET